VNSENTIYQIIINLDQKIAFDFSCRPRVCAKEKNLHGIKLRTPVSILSSFALAVLARCRIVDKRQIVTGKTTKPGVACLSWWY